MKTIGIIGGGPAGLRAAEVAAQYLDRSGATDPAHRSSQGLNDATQIVVYDAMPSVGRKFLVAGKSGLNITNNEDQESFVRHYSGPGLPTPFWHQILNEFDNRSLRDWAAGLGIETFVASSGKVFPGPDRKGMKAAPLLRRWITRLRSMGVIFQTRHRWLGLEQDKHLLFQYQGKTVHHHHDALILALGGASWPQTGSSGNWTQILKHAGIEVNPLCSANCGWETHWPNEVLELAEGLPMKNLIVTAGEASRHGELVITRYGLEGGPIYRLGPAIRSLQSPEIKIDFKPQLSEQELVRKMGAVQRNFVREARRRWKLDPATCALLKHLPNRGPWKSAVQLAHEIKHCRIPLTQPRPIEESISSAGGICWQEIDEQLMLIKRPGIFVAGEMIDWEAPTGGYLLQGCFASGSHAGRSAAAFIKQQH